MGNESPVVKGEALSTVLSEILDAGRFNEAPALIESIDEDGLELLRAEYALYLDRLNDVEMLLERTDAPDSHRAKMIRAELAFWRGRLDEASALATALVTELEAADGEVAFEIRARMLLARCVMRRGDFETAQTMLRGPAKLAHASSSIYMQGFIAYLRAMIALKLANGQGRAALLDEAVAHFAQAGAARWEGHTRALLSIELANEGRYAEAVAECARASEVASELGIWRDEICARHMAARAHLLAGETATAIEVLVPLAEDARWCELGYSELNALYLLAFGRVVEDNPEEAGRLGAEIERLASLVETDIIPFDGRVLQAWAAARSGGADHLPGLCALAVEATAFGDGQVVDARVLLADCLTRQHPEIAACLSYAAATVAEFADRQLTRLVYDRVGRELAKGPVSFATGLEVDLRIDPLSTGVDIEGALETARRFLVVIAYLRARGNQAEAGRLLGDKYRAYFHAQWRRLGADVPELIEVIKAAARPHVSRKQGVKSPEERPDHGDGRDDGRGLDLTAVSVAALRAAGGGNGHEGRKTRTRGKGRDGEN